MNDNFNAGILKGNFVERKNTPSKNIFYTDYMIYNINAESVYAFPTRHKKGIRMLFIGVNASCQEES